MPAGKFDLTMNAIAELGERLLVSEGKISPLGYALLTRAALLEEDLATAEETWRTLLREVDPGYLHYAQTERTWLLTAEPVASFVKRDPSAPAGFFEAEARGRVDWRGAAGG